jgi:hypothetical protein
MSLPRRLLRDEGHARIDAIFAGIVCGLAIVLVALIVMGALR